MNKGTKKAIAERPTQSNSGRLNKGSIALFVFLFYHKNRMR